MIRLWCPRVDLDRVLERNHQELDPLVFDDLKVNGTLQIAHIDPAVAALHLLLLLECTYSELVWPVVPLSYVSLAPTYIGQAIGAQNLRLQPRQIVDANAILLARNGDQNVLALEHLHLLEASTRDQLVHLQKHGAKTKRH